MRLTYAVNSCAAARVPPRPQRGERVRLLLTVVLTIFGTVLSGTFVFVIGQFLLMFILQPAQELRGLIGEVGNALAYYANVYADPRGLKRADVEQASTDLRRLATRLRVAPSAILGYWLARLVCRVPKRANVLEASRGLVGLSNWVFLPPQRRDEWSPDEIREHVRAVRERRETIHGLLGLPAWD